MKYIIPLLLLTGCTSITANKDGVKLMRINPFNNRIKQAQIEYSTNGIFNARLDGFSNNSAETIDAAIRAAVETILRTK